MKNLYEPATAAEVHKRIGSLGATSERQWGTMSPAQAVAHCSLGLEWAVGDTQPPRMRLGRFLGRAIKPFVMRDDKPIKRNSPTAPTLIVQDQRDLAFEQQHLCALIDRFTTAGSAAFKTRPHSFFGNLTPCEWAILMYKHLDHHLRQFGV